MTPLLLPANWARQIEREAEKSYPHECCGVLYGNDVSGDDVSGAAGPRRVVERIEAVANEFDAGEQHHRFLITPETVMRAERLAGERGQLVLGFYHSHPDAPARPSEYDRAHAWPFYSYVIVSVAKGQAVDTTSWLLDEATERFERQDVVETNDKTNG